MEKWSPIPGFDGAYEASDLGRVRGILRIVIGPTGKRQTVRGGVLKQFPRPSGHLQVALQRECRRRSYAVHTLVLLAFVGRAPDGTEACHENGIPADNRLSNLRWGSRSSNTFDKVRHGRHPHARKSRCPRGHLLVAPNLVPSTLRRGWRQCLACQRAHNSIRGFVERGTPHRGLQVESDIRYRTIMSGRTAG